jgi:hypothetical protein
MTSYRLAYDGISADAKAIAEVVKDGDLVFAYADGMYAWRQVEEDLVKAKGAIILHITVTGNPHCAIYDGPPDNGNTRNWAAYVRARHALGYKDATIYTVRSLLATVHHNLPGMSYSVIVADPGSDPEIPLLNSVGKQFFWGRHYDKTAIYDANWHPRDKS